ncbi:MAG TPA: polyprenol monophosphomannose synthase [Planctomycetota bacterium]|nr:polyprenol monophosphomannose synthase [Planctomycetota bacterium]
MRARGLAVLPTYNEAQNVVSLATAVLERNASLEVLVVDDASPDGTGDLVEGAARSEPRLHLIRRPGKLGLGTAHLAGFRHGLEHGYACVVTMDADWSHHPRYLGELLAGMADHDLMIGSRYVRGGGVERWPVHRRLLSRFANFYTRTLLRLSVRDCTSGYRCYSRRVLEAVDPFAVTASGYSFLEEMVWRVDRAGFRIGEIPILFENRRSGTSKINRSEILRAAWHVLGSSVRRSPFRRTIRR